MIGLSDEVLEKAESLQKKEKDDRPVTPLYQSILTMKEMGLAPDQWRRLSRIDKRILHYFRVMQSYYFEFSPRQIKARRDAADAELKRKQGDLMSKMPRVAPMSRRGR